MQRYWYGNKDADTLVCIQMEFTQEETFMFKIALGVKMKQITNQPDDDITSTKYHRL